MTSNYFIYNKSKVIQALRYHFITRPEIKIMMILVNIFAIASAALFYFKHIHPLAFLISSALWFILMIVFWFLLPHLIYKQNSTFKDKLKADLTTNNFIIESERGSRSWAWQEIAIWMESPFFFHLYFNSRSFFIIPKDAFEINKVNEARNIFIEKITKK